MKKTKVLVIDDESDFLEVIATRLKSWGYDTVLCSSGKEALALFSREGADIIVVDYIMPEMNGIMVLKKIRAISRDVPAIMFTGHPDGKSIEESENLGVSAYVPKLSAYSDTLTSLKAALVMAQKQVRDGRKKS